MRLIVFFSQRIVEILSSFLPAFEYDRKDRRKRLWHCAEREKSLLPCCSIENANPFGIFHNPPLSLSLRDDVPSCMNEWLNGVLSLFLTSPCLSLSLPLLLFLPLAALYLTLSSFSIYPLLASFPLAFPYYSSILCFFSLSTNLSLPQCSQSQTKPRYSPSSFCPASSIPQLVSTTLFWSFITDFSKFSLVLLRSNRVEFICS